MIKSPSSTKKRFWSKLGLSSLVKEGRHGKEETDSLRGKSSNVNEEYKEAFRTNSYIEICNKVQDQLETRKSSSSSSSSSSHHNIEQVHLSEYLLEPRQETLDSIFNQSSNNRHRSLVNFFDISLEAGEICELLLQNVHQARINYHTVKNAIIGPHTEYDAIYRKIASFAFHKNPFSSVNRDKFQDLHNRHLHLLLQLTSQYRKTKRRSKFIRFIKRALITGLIAGPVALAIALLIVSLHTIVGLVAAPGLLVLCSLGIFFTKKLKRAKRKSRKKRVDQDRGIGSQLDIAARGVYILINDFDTMSRLVQRLHDEVEHMRFLSEICVRKGKKNREMLREVVREFQMHEGLFLEELEELEKQIYLCFLDINRTRRLLVQEIDKC